MDENETKKLTEIDWAKINLEREWKDVKYADDRGNQIADKMIITEIQAAAIFITLISVFLDGEGVKAEKLLLVGILVFAVSIVLGIFGFYIKELYWKDIAIKHNLVSREWAEVCSGKTTEDHAKKMIQFIRGGTTLGSRSTSWPMILQTTSFIIALIVSFIGLANNF